MKTPDDPKGVVARFADGPDLLEHALEGIRETDLDKQPSAGGWTIREIVHHIVDGDDIWKICIKTALGGKNPEFDLSWYRALPQEDWTERWAYKSRSLDVSLAFLRAGRNHLVQLMENIPDGWTRTFVFRKADGGEEQVSIGAVIGMQADHLEHHVKRIRDIRSEIGD